MKKLVTIILLTILVIVPLSASDDVVVLPMYRDSLWPVYPVYPYMWGGRNGMDWEFTFRTGFALDRYFEPREEWIPRFPGMAMDFDVVWHDRFGITGTYAWDWGKYEHSMEIHIGYLWRTRLSNRWTLDMSLSYFNSVIFSDPPDVALGLHMALDFHYMIGRDWFLSLGFGNKVTFPGMLDEPNEKYFIDTIEPLNLGFGTKF